MVARSLGVGPPAPPAPDRNNYESFMKSAYDTPLPGRNDPPTYPRPQYPRAETKASPIEKFPELSKTVIDGLCATSDLIRTHSSELGSCELTSYTDKATAGLKALMEVSRLYGFQHAELEGLKNEIARLRANQKG